MTRNLATCAVLTIAVDHLYALPAKLGPTLSAIHVTTPSILLDALRALWTLLGLFLNGSEALVLLLKSIFDAGLVLFAGFVLVPWAIAGNASFGAAVLAGADIRCARSFSWRLVFVSSNCGADAFSDPAGPGGTFGVA